MVSPGRTVENIAPLRRALEGFYAVIASERKAGEECFSTGEEAAAGPVMVNSLSTVRSTDDLLLTESVTLQSTASRSPRSALIGRISAETVCINS